MIYVMSAPSVQKVKIGFSARLNERASSVRMHSPVDVHVVARIPGDKTNERELQQRFSADWSHGEWFNMTPAIEALIAEFPSDVPTFRGLNKKPRFMCPVQK